MTPELILNSQKYSHRLIQAFVLSLSVFFLSGFVSNQGCPSQNKIQTESISRSTFLKKAISIVQLHARPVYAFNLSEHFIQQLIFLHNQINVQLEWIGHQDVCHLILQSLQFTCTPRSIDLHLTTAQI